MYHTKIFKLVANLSFWDSKRILKDVLLVTQCHFFLKNNKSFPDTTNKITFSKKLKFTPKKTLTSPPTSYRFGDFLTLLEREGGVRGGGKWWKNIFTDCVDKITFGWTLPFVIVLIKANQDHYY